MKKIGTDDNVVNASIAVSGMTCFLYYLIKGKRRLIEKSSVYAFALSVLMVLSVAYNGNANLSNILWIWSYLGVALLLYDKGINKTVALCVFVLYVGVFFYDAFAHGIQYEELSVTSGSVNNISTLCILSMCVYYLSIHRSNPDVNIEYWPIVIVTFLSVLTATRSSLMALAVFFFLALLYNGRGNRHKIKYIIGLGAVIVTLLYFYLYYFDIFGGQLTAKTDRLGMESVRVLIWKDYFNGLLESLGNFFLGVPGTDSKYVYLSFYSGNTHNAFLMLHSKYGLLGFILFVSMLIKAIVKGLKKKDYFLCSVFVLLVIRSSFDWTAFPGMYDIFYWYFLIYAFDVNVNTRKMVRSTR